MLVQKMQKLHVVCFRLILLMQGSYSGMNWISPVWIQTFFSVFRSEKWPVFLSESPVWIQTFFSVFRQGLLQLLGGPVPWKPWRPLTPITFHANNEKLKNENLGQNRTDTSWFVEKVCWASIWRPHFVEARCQWLLWPQ